jgi:TetR/AcrR family transcriptional regulator, cholesterol catabolism regulator
MGVSRSFTTQYATAPTLSRGKCTRKRAQSRAWATVRCSVASMARRLTARGERRRRQLVDYAARTFATRGYHPTSISEIVDGLGVGKGVFYWYFESKEELFRQILTEAQRDLRRALRRAVEDEPDPVRRIEAGIIASVQWLDSNRHLFALLEFARTEERFSPLIRRGDEQAVADALPHVKAGIAAELIRRDDPLVLTHGILGVTYHLARVLMLEEGRSASECAQATTSFCLEGILAPSTAARRLGRAAG